MAQRSTDSLHPFVYRAIIALTIVFVIAGWGFALRGYTSLTLGIVTFFGIITIVIPLTLRRIWLHHREEAGRAEEPSGSFRDWLTADFNVWGDHMSGTTAAITLLLPIFAAALGALALSIVFQIVSFGVR